ncbi:hypothetical protein KFF05_08250 [bacterium SCSIO 12827]|nr:hypothetical protein KFF05_08250 [bacterium SCSIO 12827]
MPYNEILHIYKIGLVEFLQISLCLGIFILSGVDAYGGNLMWRRVLFKLKDSRVLLVVGAVVVAYAASGIGGYFYSDLLHVNADAIVVAVYASWVQDVLFFSLVGIAVLAFTAPFRPDIATFDERIIAFYGSRSPKPLRDYAKEELKRYGGYSPYAERSWTISDYREDINAFKISANVKYNVKNIFDVEYYDNPKMSVRPDKFDIDVGVVGEVEWISVNDVGQLANGREAIDSERGWNGSIDLRIPPNGDVLLDCQYWIWAGAGVECGFTPQRVVEHFDMVVRNSTDGVPIKLGLTGGKIVDIRPGEVYKMAPEENATPNDRIFVLSLDVIEEPA